MKIKHVGPARAMKDSIVDLVCRAISPGQVQSDGPLTMPRSYGLYSIPTTLGATRKYRFGNHPVRMRELEHEFGSCKMEHLFLCRMDAKALAALLNGSKA